MCVSAYCILYYYVLVTDVAQLDPFVSSMAPYVYRARDKFGISYTAQAELPAATSTASASDQDSLHHLIFGRFRCRNSHRVYVYMGVHVCVH